MKTKSPVKWNDELIDVALRLSASNVANLNPRVAKAIADEAKRERLKLRLRRLATVATVLAIVLAMLLLSGCSSSGGGVVATAEAMGTRIPGAGGKPSATPFPTQPPAAQVIEATREVEVTRIVEATVEVVREVPVVVTPTPDVAGFEQPTGAPCDPRTPQPTIQLDATDIAAGVVLRGQGCPQG